MPVTYGAAQNVCPRLQGYDTVVPPHLKALDELCMRPPHFLRQAAQNAEAATRSEADDLKSLRHNHALLLVVRSWDTLEALHSQAPGHRDG